MDKNQKIKLMSSGVAGIAVISLCSVALLRGCSAEPNIKETTSSSVLRESEKETTKSMEPQKKKETAKLKGKIKEKQPMETEEDRTEETVSKLYDRAGIRYSTENSSPNLTRKELQEIAHVSQTLSNKKEEAKKQEEAKENLLNTPEVNLLHALSKNNDLMPVSNKRENIKDEQTKPTEEPIVPFTPYQPEPTPLVPVEIIDYSALQGVLSSTETIDGSVYLTAGYQALQTEISIGRQMLTNQEASQSEVNAQTLRIQQAIDSLVPKGNKASLGETITKAKSINLEQYTTASADNFDRVYTQALTVYHESELTQQEVDTQVSALNHAMDQLVKRGDKTELRSLVEQAKQVDRQIYTAESLQGLDQAIGEGEAVLTNEDATQEQVNEASNKLKSTFDSLEKIGEPDLSLVYLNRLIEACESLSAEDYTSASFLPFEGILNQSKELLKQEGITQEQVQKQMEDLEQAKENLVKKADKTALTSMIEEVSALQEEDYTLESWMNLQTAVNRANDVLSNEDATQEQVNEAVEVLHNEKNALIEKEV
ncbi:hypothetical protein [Enterococcus faecium]|uniref:Uncharacterized protein n=1 Tax=Enterococcus faecium TaxID=1352 RepID=A0A9X3XU92_ENTFC|nr:hypothetical protein [Enterococcus faecium]MDC4248077.1 hypothetical protein [Enterococcus faecium]